MTSAIKPVTPVSLMRSGGKLGEFWAASVNIDEPVKTAKNDRSICDGAPRFFKAVGYIQKTELRYSVN